MTDVVVQPPRTSSLKSTAQVVERAKGELGLGTDAFVLVSFSLFADFHSLGGFVVDVAARIAAIEASPGDPCRRYLRVVDFLGAGHYHHASEPRDALHLSRLLHLPS